MRDEAVAAPVAEIEVGAGVGEPGHDGGGAAGGPPGAGAGPAKLRRLAEDFSGIVIWVLLVILFGVLVPDTFLTTNTARSVLSDQAITAMMALALIPPLAANVFDLSIGSMMGFAVIVVASLMSKLGWAPVPAVVATLACGAAVGILNGFLVVKLGVNSFIATLGMSSILLAMIEWVSGGNHIVGGIPQSFKDFSQTQIATIPLPVFYLAIMALLLWYFLTYRQTGRYLYAIGSNPDAARLAGVRTDRLIWGSLIASSLLATVAGIIFMAKIGSASLDAGPPYLLPAFAAVFLGATQLRARRVNVVGTLIAVYLLATGVKGLQLMGSPLWVDDLFNGVALIAAVALAAQAGRIRLR